MKRITVLWVLALAAAFFFNCKDQDVQLPDTGIVLTVQDAGGSLVSDAEVFLFDNEEDFDAFGNSLGGTNLLQNFIMTTTTNSNGEASFSGLDSKVYWFYVQKGSTNNFKSQFKLPNDLVENATTYVLITLEQFVTERVQFYTTDEGVSSNPITVFVSQNGTIDQSNGFVIDGVANLTDGTNPDPLDLESTLVFGPEFGSTTFYIKNENGCVWQKNIELSSEEPSVQVVLEPCEVGLIRFKSDLGVSIEFNNGEEIGELDNTTLDVYRPLGTTYSFKASSNDGSCSWINTVTPKSEEFFTEADVVEFLSAECE